jgi:prepilin peptidase CpaA
MLYFLIVAAVVAGIAAWTDTRTGIIPNWLTVGTFVFGLIANLVAGWHLGGGWRGGLWGVAFSIGGAAFCAAVPALAYRMGAIGGGDVKLFAAIGALCQPMIGLEIEVYAFVAAALIAPAKLAYQGVLLQTIGRSFALVINPLRKPENRKEIPSEVMTWFRLGPAIFLGAATTLLLHWDFR